MNLLSLKKESINIKGLLFEMDFIVEKRDNTIHVLNAVSPAFTSAFSFAKYILSGQ
jgi:hypothetical protein